MRIALVQQHATDDVDANLARAEASTRQAAERGAKLVVFAELAFTPFWPQARANGDPRSLAEPIPGPITERFQRLAAELGLVVVPNLYERDADSCYDTSPVIDADGTLLGKTRMIHVCDFERFHERDYYTPGDTGAPVYDTSVGRLGVAICYDRHFPEYMRALALAGAQLVLVPQAQEVSEWPDGLFEAEMQVQAFHHGYFTALCNRVGRETASEFAGGSFVCGPDGTVVDRAPERQDHLLLCDLDLDQVERSHARSIFLPDRRPELYPDWL